jgi:cytochrome c553
MRPAAVMPALAAVWALFATPDVLVADTTPSTSPLEFFEKKVRPALVEHCGACHSAGAAAKNKLKGGLRLDSREAMLAGGDSGPALVPGKPGESLLIKSLSHTDDLKMPPKGKLPAAVIADLATWVRMGAPAPAAAAGPKAAKGGIDLQTGRNFWAYKLPVAPEVPAVRDAAWPAGDIDRFIRAALDAKGLTPAADADRATLARRLYFDLTGLPPTPEQIDAFVADTDPQAYEKLVGALLASPAFGERWGRHWLDTARYADSVTLRGLIYPEAWRYRDYVIDCFNRDLPFDRFLKEQLAGDLLPADSVTEKARQITATGYLQLGNTNLEEQDKKQLRMDIVDEQLDVITKGMLGQTVTCARCHDHKFDPIPTKDYYALAGILRNVKSVENANVGRWVEVMLPSSDPAQAKALQDHEAAVAAMQEQIRHLKAKAVKTAPGASPGALAVKDVPGIVVDDAQAMKVGKWYASAYGNAYIGAGYLFDGNSDKGKKSITFDPDLPATGKYEVWFAYTPFTNRTTAAPVTVFSADGEKELKIDQTQTPPIGGRFISLGQYQFEKGGQSFVLVSNEGTKGHVVADAVAFIPVDAMPSAVAATTGTKNGTPTAAAGDDLKKLEAKLKKLQADKPQVAMAMTVLEEKVIEDTKVHVRGSVHNLGEPAPRGFLQVATHGTPPAMPADQSGRLQLAEWIASRQNPLTARVYVNRAWHWLFGSGLVRTTDNFGTTGELPSHPELLDHLATRFMDNKWSVKTLVRDIVLSRTYRQASVATRKAIAADPENRLFGRANRRRLEGEAIRDGMLLISGKLDGTRGGSPIPAKLSADYGFKHTALVRSVYLPQFRNAIPEILEAFDGADPSLVTGKRSASTVAPQALFLMNNPFVLDQAKASADRLLAEKLPGDAVRVRRAYRLTLGREPTAGERAVAGKFLAARTADPRDAWAALFQALFASADFRYVN